MGDKFVKIEKIIDELQGYFFELRKFFNKYPETYEKFKEFLEEESKEDLIY